MEIVKYPHPALRWVTKPIPQVDDEIRRIAREMLEAMYAARGIGLAATQVALPWQIFVLNIKPDDPSKAAERVFINPQILERKGLVEEEEGCLSLPGVYARVKRAERIKVAALGLDGAPFELSADGLESRAIQHEVDHLQGILFIDKLNPLAKLGVIGKIKEFERAYRRGQTPSVVATPPESTETTEPLEM
jgi:peptide deformylase